MAPLVLFAVKQIVEFLRLRQECLNVESSRVVRLGNLHNLIQVILNPILLGSGLAGLGLLWVGLLFLSIDNMGSDFVEV